MSKIYGTRPWFAIVDDIVPATPPDPPDPRIVLYKRALVALLTRDQRWASNYNRFIKWDTRAQLKWIAYIEKSAQADPPLPMARELLLTAFTLRMTT